MQIDVVVSDETHVKYVPEILETIEISAKQRGTGIAKRSVEYVEAKLKEKKAVIAITKDGRFAGFSYIEIFQNGKYLVNSGLIVHHDFRNMGLAKKIKAKIFEYSKEIFPDAKIFGITTSMPVLKINSQLGYKPVTFSELPQDEKFWNGCKTCVNFDVLTRTNRQMCLCTGMLYDPESKDNNNEKFDFEKKSKVLERLRKIKLAILLTARKIKRTKKFLRVASL